MAPAGAGNGGQTEVDSEVEVVQPPELGVMKSMVWVLSPFTWSMEGVRKEAAEAYCSYMLVFTFLMFWSLTLSLKPSAKQTSALTVAGSVQRPPRKGANVSGRSNFLKWCFQS